ncbi:uncharacterized protein [Periplaneta americana]|uniref:uncharacterized protein n=1 Tax=Periplaneta americana TaxID=6978 RepID=UPI0037E88343
MWEEGPMVYIYLPRRESTNSSRVRERRHIVGLGMARLILKVSAVLLVLAGVSESAPSIGRLSEAQWESYHEMDHRGPGTYAFGYDVEDPANGNMQFRQEERHPNGTVTGSYGVVEPNGNIRVVHYVSDDKGYRVTIENSNAHKNANSDTKVVPNFFNSIPPSHLSGKPQVFVQLRPQRTNVYSQSNVPVYRNQYAPSQTLRPFYQVTSNNY